MKQERGLTAIRRQNQGGKRKEKKRKERGGKLISGYFNVIIERDGKENNWGWGGASARACGAIVFVLCANLVWVMVLLLRKRIAFM